MTDVGVTVSYTWIRHGSGGWMRGLEVQTYIYFTDYGGYEVIREFQIFKLYDIWCNRS